MKKTDLLKEVAVNSGLSNSVVETVYKEIIDTITSQLKKGEEVALTGFGTFKVTERKARDGRNPATGEKIKIAASKSPSFKAGKTLKDNIK